MNRHAAGSLWHRWDPHIHAPGTLLNNQFGDNAWEAYLTKIEKSEPRIRALGITDYYTLDTYEAVARHKAEGRLQDADLIFPNVEFRYAIGTGSNKALNGHLLVSPEDPDHVKEIRRFLRSLTFEAHGETYHCDPEDLIRLGKRHSPKTQDDHAALREGANQFKVNFPQLREQWTKSEWIRANVLVAVAGSNKDGTAGLQEESLATLRKEIERFAHIIFASQPSQRTFWIGAGKVGVSELFADWGGPKPCLHGCDAHSLEKVGNPDLDRRTWIKGDLAFEALRQACLEPGTRAMVGEAAPTSGLDSLSIRGVKVEDAPWLGTPQIPLNPGLVTIIGARGSGKTALADIIAAGAFAPSAHSTEKSFLYRARKLLGTASATLTWGVGETTKSSLRNSDGTEPVASPRVQYLSQHFVEKLCSTEGVTGELLREIQRVVFQSVPHEDRLGSTSFDELLGLRTKRAREGRRQNEMALDEASRRINSETQQKESWTGLLQLRKEKTESLAVDRETRSSFITSGGEDRAQRLEDLTAAADALSRTVDSSRQKLQALVDLQNEVTDIRQRVLVEMLVSLKERYSGAGLAEDEWSKFELDFTGDVDSILVGRTASLSSEIASLVGTPPATTDNAVDFATPFVADEASLASQTLADLRSEIARLTGLAGLDDAKQQALKRLNEKIAQDEAKLAKIERDIEVAAGASERIAAERRKRISYYTAIFDAVVGEQDELVALYSPLSSRLDSELGTLGKLGFSVRRVVNAESWAQAGEELLDLRKSGPFRGKGSLLAAAAKELIPAWQEGDSNAVAEAINRFLDDHEAALLDHAPVDRADAAAYFAWERNVSRWLYDTSHITVAYRVLYEGADIEQLSPGTRGIVLLLLYLAIDQDDLRPLIIDQPEENLDPKSIFTELVERFRQAKTRRQVILVTHNANLVVNTDADQVIIAKGGRHRINQLPQISYISGGLDNPQIRNEVCEILEGGEAAFQERARRLRVRV